MVEGCAVKDVWITVESYQHTVLDVEQVLTESLLVQLSMIFWVILIVCND